MPKEKRSKKKGHPVVLILFEISSWLEIDELAALKQHRFLNRHDFESNHEPKQAGKIADAQHMRNFGLSNAFSYAKSQPNRHLSGYPLLAGEGWFERAKTRVRSRKVQPFSVQRFNQPKTCFEASWQVWSADDDIFESGWTGVSPASASRCAAKQILVWSIEHLRRQKASEESRPFNWPQVIEMVECSWHIFCILLFPSHFSHFPFHLSDKVFK
jgi:hypothetical protein